MKQILALTLVFVSGCTIAPRITVSNGPSSNVTGAGVIDGKIYTTAYQQTAAEYRALCYQAYNIARLRIDQLLGENHARPRAIVTDIDETVLNNSAFEAHQTLQGKDYTSADWTVWANKIAADTLPGSLDFLTYAASKGFEIFYVTNRDSAETSVTLENLRKFHFPDADSSHFLPMAGSSSKESRRQRLSEHYQIVMLLGDNLGDFSALFDRKTVQERNDNVNALREEFGDRFIILPNPTYGDWESSLYHYSYGLTGAQKDSVIRGSLYSY